MNEQTTQTAYTIQTKSLLARLMATENIKVEHRVNRKTASFDLKTRTLYCPTWKDMSADLYDLLIGHEISHALRTPMEGWHDAVIYAGGNAKASRKEQDSFKHFLNVVEDARIEKLLKRQYPGIRRPMVQGYKELLARDFFGLSAISDFNDLYLIDKLNLAAKIGTSLGIRFTAKEKPFYEKLMALETWNDVLFLSRELYAYSKTEQKEGEQKKKELKRHLDEEARKEREEEGEDGEGEEGDGYEGDEDYEDEEESEESGEGFEKGDESEEDKDSDGEGVEKSEDSDEGEDSKEGEESDSEGDSAKGDEEEKADDSTTEKSEDDGDGDRSDSEDDNATEKHNPSDGRDASEGANDEEDFVPKSRTDESFRDKEDTLVDNGNVESEYVTIPVPYLKDIVTPASIVNGALNQFYVMDRRDLGVRLLAEFKQKNEDYIMLLAKEFEMKKAARSYKLAKISESGDIDINKLARFRMEDKIFKRLMIVNKGKSHGLVLILDKSGSMSPHIRPAMEQILVLAMFCRKVNIPFVAYSFCNSAGAALNHDFKDKKATLKQFSQRIGDIRMEALEFRELFNSKMPAAEFNQAIMNHLMLAEGLSSSLRGRSHPSHENMGSTPLNEALVVLRDVLRNFKAAHRLDIVNAVIVHDGDSDGNNDYYAEVANKYSGYNRNPIHWTMCNVTIRDTKERLSIQANRTHNGFTTALLQWIQMTSGCGVFGFYITGNSQKTIRTSLYKMYRNKQGVTLGIEPRYKQSPTTEKAILLDALTKEIKDQKFLESFSEGYTRFFFIPGAEDLAIENEKLLDNGKAWTPSRLLSAFKRINKRKAISRVLVTKFIELMAVK